MSDGTPQDHAASFGRWVQANRLAAGLTVEQLAAHYVKRDGTVGCDPSYITAVEAGKYLRMSSETHGRMIEAIAAANLAKRTRGDALNANPLRGPGFRKDAQSIKQDFQRVIHGKQEPTQPIPSKRLDIEAVLTGATFSFSLAALLALLYILLEGI